MKQSGSVADAVADQVIDFHSALFRRIFYEPCEAGISERIKRKAVARQIDEAADAASQSLTRFLLNERLPADRVGALLEGLAALGDLLNLDDVANPNVTPESLAESLFNRLPLPGEVFLASRGSVHRVALHSVVQVLMLVGPVISEWQRLGFPSTFELLDKIVGRLNQISERLELLGRAGEAASDERYDLSYRDYLMQRFHRVEAGTVRMATNLDVDLRELFVMPRLRPRLAAESESGPARDEASLMHLRDARQLFGSTETQQEDEGIPALDQVRGSMRPIIVGPPGAGKSTFLEWLQLKTASAEEELVCGEEQAIPVLLRVRELDPRNLPRGAAVVQHATASKDRAALMPPAWLERQMKAGRVLFMLDGLDETEPELRDKHVLPWLAGICRQYPDCRYLVSSRPVGYPAGNLRELQFAECDLADFNDDQILQYSQHWCTAVRLARNESDAEARREGAAKPEVPVPEIMKVLKETAHHPAGLGQRPDNRWGVRHGPPGGGVEGARLAPWQGRRTKRSARPLQPGLAA